MVGGRWEGTRGEGGRRMLGGWGESGMVGEGRGGGRDRGRLREWRGSGIGIRVS